jgi:hypothetical protein
MCNLTALQRCLDGERSAPGLSMVFYCFERGVLGRVIYARRLSLVYEAVFRLDFSDQLQSRAPEFMHGATLCGAQGRIVFQKMEYSAQDTYGRAKWSLVHGMFTKSGKFIQGVFEVYGGNLWKATEFGLSMVFYGFGRGVLAAERVYAEESS